MSGRTRLWFTIIVVIAFAAMMITFMPMQQVVFEPLGINRNISLRQGLDLSGGSQVLLQATNCTGENLAERMDNARRIIEARVNGLGVTEPIVQLAGDCRILVELPPSIILPKRSTSWSRRAVWNLSIPGAISTMKAPSSAPLAILRPKWVLRPISPRRSLFQRQRR
jgi:preprotein translocase subunit SecD